MEVAYNDGVNPKMHRIFEGKSHNPISPRHSVAGEFTSKMEVQLGESSTDAGFSVAGVPFLDGVFPFKRLESRKTSRNHGFFIVERLLTPDTQDPSCSGKLLKDLTH